MTAQQEFREKLVFEEETSDQQRSILLVDIMNAIGFSKSEQDIWRHSMHLTDELVNIFMPDDKSTVSMRGSLAEGMAGGMYNNKSDHDYDMLTTYRHIKLYTPRTNNINNPPLLLLHDNVDYDASFFVEEDDNFPGYVKLSLAEVKTNCVDLYHCRRMDDKFLLSNSVMMANLCEQYDKSSTTYTDAPPQVRRLIDICTKIDINGPAQTNHVEAGNGRSKKA